MPRVILTVIMFIPMWARRAMGATVFFRGHHGRCELLESCGNAVELTERRWLRGRKSALKREKLVRDWEIQCECGLELKGTCKLQEAEQMMLKMEAASRVSIAGARMPLHSDRH